MKALKADTLDAEITPGMEALIKEFGASALAAIGSKVRFDIRNPLTNEFLDGWRNVRLVGINDTTANQLRDVLEAASKRGEGIDGIARDITGMFEDISKGRAQRIARTEVVSSANGANLAAWELSGAVEGKEWLSVQDNNTRDDHRAMDKKVVKMGEDFVLPSGDRGAGPGQFGIAEQDINCFPGDTSVLAPSLAHGMFRRKYSGRLVTLETASGARLSGTPNHPILTPRGWVALGMLNEGDEVFECVAAEVGSRLPNNVNNVPPSFEKVFNLASVSSVSSRVAPGDVKQFHGDGAASDIDVVSVNGKLGNTLQAEGFESLYELDLSSADLTERALSRDGALVQSGSARVAAPDRIMSPASIGTALICGHTAHSEPHPGGSVANGDAIPNEVSQHARSRDAESSGQGEQTFAAKISRHRITKLSVAEFSGHVYNLQTDGEWYLANGIIAHNCRCTLLPKLDEKAADVDRVAKWRAFDAAMTDAEERLTKHVQAAFDAQLAEVLAALRA